MHISTKDRLAEIEQVAHLHLGDTDWLIAEVKRLRALIERHNDECHGAGVEDGQHWKCDGCGRLRLKRRWANRFRLLTGKPDVEGSVVSEFKCSCDPKTSQHERMIRGALRNMRDDCYLEDAIEVR